MIGVLGASVPPGAAVAIVLIVGAVFVVGDWLVRRVRGRIFDDGDGRN